MSDKLNSINENMMVARDITNALTGNFLRYLQSFREDKTRVMTNRELTEEGKRKKLEREQQRHEVAVMKMIHNERTKRDEHLNAAIKDATAIITADLPKVDAETEKLFMQRVDELEGKVLYATNANTARQALEEMAANATEPALAAIVRDRIRQLTQQVLPLANEGEQLTLRQALGRLYEDVSNRALPVGAKEARERLETAKGLLSAPMVSELILNNLGEISNDAVRYANNTTAYFNEKGGLVREIEMRGSY